MKTILVVRVVLAIYSLCISSAALAADQAFGDWFVVSTSDRSGDTIAGTFSDGTKTAFAVRCFAKTGKCMHLVRLGWQCDDGESYPILINAPSGAAAVTGICNVNNGDPEMILTPFDDVRAALKGVGMFGVAVPMASGAFKAVRFSLKGSDQAIKRGEDLATRNSRSSTSDTNKRGTVTF